MTPVVKAEMIFGTSLSTPDFALDGTGLVHADVFQPAFGFVGRLGRVLADLEVCDVIPPITIRTMRTARATAPRRTIAAPAVRGIRCAVNERTTGAATVATIVQQRPARRSSVSSQAARRSGEQEEEPDEEPRTPARGHATIAAARRPSRADPLPEG
jgi:hypothetical protein